MNVIEVKNLKKKFGKTKALDGVSFSVKKGEIFGFLGPNGAGKTTAIRAMMDFINPTSGKIKIFGSNSQKDSVELKKKIGYLTSDLKLYDDWTGQDHFTLIEKIRGKSEILDQLIKEFSFNPKMKVKKLSSGNKQKLGIILALMGSPEILILDEPTRGLDPLLQNAFYKILRDLQKQGCTIFMSSHNLSEVEKICSRVAIIREGKLVAIENIEKILEKKVHIVSAYFANKFSPQDFKIKGVEIIDEMPNGLVFKVQGDINSLIKKLSSYTLKDLEITHASLEDIFLEFYKGK